MRTTRFLGTLGLLLMTVTAAAAGPHEDTVHRWIDRHVGEVPWSGAPLHADRVVRAYRTNRLAADSAAKYQVLEVRGEVVRVDRDEDIAYVVLKGSTDDDFCFETLRCYVYKNREASLMSLQPGEIVTIKGMMTTKVWNGDVAMLGCRLVTAARRRHRR